MKKWNFKVKYNPKEIINKLESALESFGGFVINVDHGINDSVKFNFRKRIKYPDQILHRNRTIVNGTLVKSDNENETDVEISFTQHIFMTLTVLSMVLLILVLIAIIPSVSSGISMYIFEAISLGLGVVLWINVKKKFERDIQNYKTLISKILDT